MCNSTCLDFLKIHLTKAEAEGKFVIESGSRDVNGSYRPWIESLGAAKYIGTDIVEGPRVDQICNAENLVATFGKASFDILVSTEVIEHVEHWREVISNYKRIVKPGGLIFITTRSEGFGWHGYPHDYWRYEVADMQEIFKDFEILQLQSDPFEPGVFIKARKPKRFVEKDLSEIALYSINTLTRIK